MGPFISFPKTPKSLNLHHAWTCSEVKLGFSKRRVSYTSFIGPSNVGTLLFNVCVIWIKCDSNICYVYMCLSWGCNLTTVPWPALMVSVYQIEPSSQQQLPWLIKYILRFWKYFSIKHCETELHHLYYYYYYHYAMLYFTFPSNYITRAQLCLSCS